MAKYFFFAFIGFMFLGGFFFDMGGHVGLAIASCLVSAVCGFIAVVQGAINSEK